MVGLPETLRMRERGHLSQVDLAHLTGLGIGVIQRLEAGRGRPDAAVLDAVATALRMLPDERRVFYELALGHPPSASTFATDADPGLVLYVRHIRGPAIAVDAMFNVLYGNEFAQRWLPGCGAGTNYANWLLLDPLARRVVVDWDLLATRVVSRLREVAARFGSDERVGRLIAVVRQCERVDAMWRDEPGLYHVPMVQPVVLRRPGQLGPGGPDDESRVAATMVTLHSPRLDDERRVLAFVFDDVDECLAGAGGEGRAR
jgi:transcriptional regulator with XRE-family HTH domain